MFSRQIKREGNSKENKFVFLFPEKVEGSLFKNFIMNFNEYQTPNPLLIFLPKEVNQKNEFIENNYFMKNLKTFSISNKKTDVKNQKILNTVKVFNKGKLSKVFNSQFFY